MNNNCDKGLHKILKGLEFFEVNKAIIPFYTFTYSWFISVLIINILEKINLKQKSNTIYTK